jgi:hypothetical protein
VVHAFCATKLQIPTVQLLLSIVRLLHSGASFDDYVMLYATSMLKLQYLEKINTFSLFRALRPDVAWVKWR